MTDRSQTAGGAANTELRGDMHWQRFSVPFEYPVLFTEGVFDPENFALREAMVRLEPDKCHRFVVFVDDGLVGARPGLEQQIAGYAAAHHEALNLVADPILVPGGETIKQELHFVERAQRQLYEHHIDRHSYAIAVGGGAVLDAMGLVAATTHRGVRHVRIPTTVLSQNDSGIGVKNGVNLYGQKNFVGAFAPPFAVVNDIEFIDSLAPRDRVAGMAEAVKVALIRDAEFFVWMERNADALAVFERKAMARMIRRCAELHMYQIAAGGDPFEMGSARPLDYGHWAAHRLEGMTNHHLRHGEAVAIGIALDTRYAVLEGRLPAGEDDRICFLLEHLGFRLWHPALEQTEKSGTPSVLQGLRDFREHLGGELSVTLLEAVGKAVEVHEMDEARIGETIAWLKSREAS